MSFSLIYICCSFRGGILSVVCPTVATCFWPAGVLECPCPFSDLILFPFLLLFSYIVPYPCFSSMSFSLIYICSSLILFPFLLLFFYIVPYPSCSSMSFSLIYICCSFRGGILFILSVVFPAVAICFWPAGNLECPCLFSDLILFPFLLLFFYIVTYPSFSSMSFSLIYICCSFREGILSVVFPSVAICFWPAGNLECPCLFSDLILFPFLLLFFYIVPYPSFSYVFFIDLVYICCSFWGGILSVVFPAVAICFWPAGNLECPCLFSDRILFPFLLLFFYIVPYPSFSSMSFSLIYICCSFRGGILSVVCPTVATCFWPAGNLECPCLFSDLILFPFLLLFFYIVPYPSFSSMSFSLIYICSSLILFPFLLLFFYIVPYPSCSSMSFSLIYICCSFRGGILSVVFRTVAICFWPAGNLECPCLFSDLILFPFLLLFFYIVTYPSFSSMSFSLIYICCSFRGGILSIVFPAVAICFWPAGNLECPCSFSPILFLNYSSFSSMSFSLIYICCSFRGGIPSVVFPTVALCLWPAGNLECPCLFSDLILFPFLLLFFYIVPYPSFSSMSFSLIYTCCSFRGGILFILSVVFPTVAICFWPAGNLECPCLFSDLILFPFLLLFFYIVP